MLRNINPNRFMVSLNGAQNTAATGISSGGGFTRQYVDYNLPVHDGDGDATQRTAMTTWDDGVVIMADADIATTTFIKSSDMKTSSAFRNATVQQSDQFAACNDGTNVYVGGKANTSGGNFIHKFGTDGTFSSGVRWTNGSGSTNSITCMFSNATNVFVGGFNGAAYFLAKLDTDLALVTGDTGATYQLLTLTGDATNLWWGGTTIISKWLISSMTLVDDKTLQINASAVQSIAEIVIDGTDLVICGDELTRAYICDVQLDLAGVGTGVIQNSGVDIRAKGMVKLGTSWFVCGYSDETDTEAVLLEFDSSYTLLNAKSLRTQAGTQSLQAWSITTDGTDIYMAVWDGSTTSQRRYMGVFRVQNGDMTAGAFTSDMPTYYTWDDYTCGFTAATPALAAVTNAMTTNLSTTSIANSATDVGGAIDAIVQFTA